MISFLRLRTKGLPTKPALHHFTRHVTRTLAKQKTEENDPGLYDGYRSKKKESIKVLELRGVVSFSAQPVKVAVEISAEQDLKLAYIYII